MLFDVFIHVLLIGSFNIFNITQHQLSKLIQLQNSGHWYNSCTRYQVLVIYYIRMCSMGFLFLLDFYCCCDFYCTVACCDSKTNTGTISIVGGLFFYEKTSQNKTFTNGP